MGLSFSFLAWSFSRSAFRLSISADCSSISFGECFLNLLRVDLSKDQRSGGQSSKFDFAYYLYIGRPRYYTYEIKVYLAKYCFVSKKFEYDCKRYFSS